jgi:hypothetical protein
MAQGSSPIISETLQDLSTTQESIPESLVLFKDSIAYFQSALSEADDLNSRNVMRKFIAHGTRCKKRWTIVEKWLPKILLTGEVRQQGYALTNLVKTTMKVSDKYRNHQNFAYRNQWLEFRQQLQSQTHAQTMHQNSNANLESCVAMTRCMAIAMADMLEEKWQLILAKHISKSTNNVSMSPQQQIFDEIS